MNFFNMILGRPLKTSEERAEQIGTTAGVPIFGLDALSSAAYGPEAALVLLIPLGLAGLRYIVPISCAVIALMVIVYFSYRQTIAAYPNGGGSYTVARFNLGAFCGLLAAAALLADYILTVAVGISAGVGALVSAVPRLLPHTLGICLIILVLITIVNLRGVKDAGLIFALPTYVFVGTLLITIVGGILRAILAGGHPIPVAPLPPAGSPTVEVLSTWLLLRVFASGCTAMTGVEAVSNGVRAFREPAVKNAQITLTVVIVILAVLLAGISYVVKLYGIVATDPGLPGYQSVISMMIGAVFGRGTFYLISMAAILIVLSLSANTAFADFPRLCRMISQNNYLPHGFSQRGRRLVYTQGILVLALLSGFLLILFDGVTDRLIPLYAVGAFLAFTLSQAGMVRHWFRTRGPHWQKYALINGLGALATGITVSVILVAKFLQGAWITLLFVPLTIVAFRAVRRHYHNVAMASRCTIPVQVAVKEEPIAVVPMDRWSAITKQGLEFASRLSKEVIAVHVEPGEHYALLEEDWDRYVKPPYVAAGLQPPSLEILPSPYRFIVLPIVQFVLSLAEKHPDRNIVVVIPEFVEDRWYEYFLHNQRARLLGWVLLSRGNKRIYTVAAPYYVKTNSKDTRSEEIAKFALKESGPE